jgi:hypothetical protein
VRTSKIKNFAPPIQFPTDLFLFFEFVSLTRNSVTTSETPVPPNSCAETVTYLQLEYAD